MLSNFVTRVSTLVQSTASNVFPYTVGDLIFESSVYKLFEGTKNGTEEKVTIFHLNRKNARQNRIDAALNCFNELKRIRHPNILKYNDGIITEEKIMFVTEYVYPLQLCIDDNNNNNTIVEHKMNESFIILCLYQISLALSFVHNELNMNHCLVLPHSIFITKGGNFVLGGFELSHTHKNIPNHFIANFDLLEPKYRPKELSINNDSIINIFINNNINFLDSWCVGCLIYELFNNFNMKNKHLSFNKPQQLSNLSLIPYNLQSFYKRLLATKPSSRITLLSLLKCDFIQQNSLVQTDKFLTEIAIKSDSEKQSFLKYLNDNIDSYPSTICKYKILPILKHLLSHGFGSNPIILSLVIKIGSEDNIDVIIQLFDNNERSTRINLLKSLPNYISNINTEIINNNIWPKLINGFTDSSPILREQSVRSIIHFAPKLNSEIINKQLLPLLDKLQSTDIEPAIRTNCCIVLGKIAKHCNINNNKQNELLLVNSFNRALNDKFLPARNAALLSFASTISLFNPNIIANKILPIIIKYTCDPYKSVRDSSFKCIQIGLQKLKQHSLTLSDQSQSDITPKNIPPKNISPNNIPPNSISPNNNNNNNLDDIFNNNKDQKEQNHKKTQNYNKTKNEQSLDDFLASFDLNETNKQTTTKVKLKTKHNSKSIKKTKQKLKTKQKVKTKEKEEDVDDFFDDW